MRTRRDVPQPALEGQSMIYSRGCYPLHAHALPPLFLSLVTPPFRLTPGRSIDTRRNSRGQETRVSARLGQVSFPCNLPHDITLCYWLSPLQRERKRVRVYHAKGARLWCRCELCKNVGRLCGGAWFLRVRPSVDAAHYAGLTKFRSCLATCTSK